MSKASESVRAFDIFWTCVERYIELKGSGRGDPHARLFLSRRWDSRKLQGFIWAAFTPVIWVNSQCLIAPREDKVLLTKSDTASKSIGVE